MDASVGRISRFQRPAQSLGTLDADLAGAVLGAATDLALVLDGAGRVIDAACGGSARAAALCAGWFERPWVETVTDESRPKVEALLRDAAAGAAPRWRQVNHPAGPREADLPVRYAALRLREDRLLALGRDQTGAHALQQRLLGAQQAVERDHVRLKQLEARSRRLFDAASDAMLIVDARTLRTLEANAAALEAFGLPERRVLGRGFPFGTSPETAERLRSALAASREGASPPPQAATLREGVEAEVHVSTLREGGSLVHLIRFSRPGASLAPAQGYTAARKLIEEGPDAFVLTDPEGFVLKANPAFLELADLTSEAAARREPLSRWLGRTEAEHDLLMTMLRSQGAVRGYLTSVRRDHGGETAVDLSAVAAPEATPPACAFLIRERVAAIGGETLDMGLARAVEPLSALVGRRPLKELVRQTTDIIERMCIEAALEMTRDNRASAAELLGLSRQSFYVKLRRYGIGEAEPNGT